MGREPLRPLHHRIVCMCGYIPLLAIDNKGVCRAVQRNNGDKEGKGNRRWKKERKKND